MQTLPDEALEQAILREGHTAGHAFVRRMMDVQASPLEGAVVLASMLVQICAQCNAGDHEHALSMLGEITRIAGEGIEPMCDYLQALGLHEESPRG